MLLRPLKRVFIADSTTAELVEPSAGLATAFITRLDELPKDKEGNTIGSNFAAMRILICLYEDGMPFLPQLINHLHETDPAMWPISVTAGDTVRHTLDAIDVSYTSRIVDYFLDTITVTQLEEMNTQIRDYIWAERTAPKND